MVLISYAVSGMPGFLCSPTAVEENKGFSPGQCAQACHKREEIFLTLPFLHKNNKTRRQRRLLVRTASLASPSSNIPSDKVFLNDSSLWIFPWDDVQTLLF